MTALALQTRTHPLGPLRVVVWGILLVAVDLNVGSVDILLDPVGYAVVAVGLSPLARLHPAFLWARAAALTGLVVSVVTMLLRRTEEVVTSSGGGFTTTTSQLVEPPLPTTLEAVVEATLVVLVCTALLDLEIHARLQGWARTLRWALPGSTLLGAALALALAPSWGTAGEVGTTSLAGPVAGLAVVLVVAGIVLSLWFLVLLWRAAHEPVGRLR